MMLFKRNWHSGPTVILLIGFAIAIVFSCGCQVIPYSELVLNPQSGVYEPVDLIPVTPFTQQDLRPDTESPVYSLGSSPSDTMTNEERIAKTWQESSPRQASLLSENKPQKSRVGSFLEKLRPGSFLKRTQKPATALASETLDPRFHHARNLEKNGQLNEAIEVYESLVYSGDQTVELSHRLAVAYDKSGKTDLSLPFYKRALTIQPENVELLCDYGYRLHLVDNSREAENYYSQALQISPTHARTQNNLAMLLAQSNRIDQALKHFRSAGLSNEQAHHNVATSLRAIRGNSASTTVTR